MISLLRFIVLWKKNEIDFISNFSEIVNIIEIDFQINEFLKIPIKIDENFDTYVFKVKMRIFVSKFQSILKCILGIRRFVEWITTI